MTKSQIQILKEVIYASKTHRKTIFDVQINASQNPNLLDVIDGLQISIDKLEQIVENSKSKK